MTGLLPIRAALLAGAALLPGAGAWAQATGGATPERPSSSPADVPPTATVAEENSLALEEIVVTGTTSRNRRLITASADITLADEADIDRRAPRSVADLLELVPGIFVEGTAGALSNNYSVRGLQGGGQRFVSLVEDGMPIVYGGGGADFFFQNDLTVDRLEAVKGGTSGILTVNGAGATINFISRALNHDEYEGIARISGYNYGLVRGDFYVSGPLTSNLAYSLGGYVQTSPGVRRNPYDYQTYRLKGALEYKFDDGGYLRLTGRFGDQAEAYYATQPYAFSDGQPRGIPGLDPQDGNIGGTAFGRIDVPVSTFVEPDGLRTFRYADGVRVTTWQARADFEKPLAEGLTAFARVRYLDLGFDFNGLFPGSGTGNGGLTSAVNYLTPGPNSPINGLLTLGQAAFPTAARFGIRNTRTGVVLGANQVAELAALNGNGLLQQTTLNHDNQSGFDFGSNFGARLETERDNFRNSFTLGLQIYKNRRRQNQSATAPVLSDVRNNANAYDVVALDANNAVLGPLTDSGLLSYGNWGAGIRSNEVESWSVYANDELAISDKLFIDGGVRYETFDATRLEGNAFAVPLPVPPGVEGVVRDVGSSFDGTFTRTERARDDVAWTVGASYLITPNLSLYGRYAVGFQTQGVDPIARLDPLYEGGIRFRAFGLSAVVTYFHTTFERQFYNFIDPLNPTIQTTLLADYEVDGVEIDATYQPIRWLAVDFTGVFQDPKLNNVNLNGVDQPGFSGNRPERTPDTLFTVTARGILPDGKGEIYARYKYVGSIFADNGNGLELPDYGVTSAGFTYNINDRLSLNFNAENIFDELGLTEGNPRQGQTQNITDGFFYARGIVGPTYGGSVTVRF